MIARPGAGEREETFEVGREHLVMHELIVVGRNAAQRVAKQSLSVRGQRSGVVQMRGAVCFRHGAGGSPRLRRDSARSQSNATGGTSVAPSRVRLFAECVMNGGSVRWAKRTSFAFSPPGAAAGEVNRAVQKFAKRGAAVQNCFNRSVAERAGSPPQWQRRRLTFLDNVAPVIDAKERDRRQIGGNRASVAAGVNRHQHLETAKPRPARGRHPSPRSAREPRSFRCSQSGTWQPCRVLNARSCGAGREACPTLSHIPKPVIPQDRAALD